MVIASDFIALAGKIAGFGDVGARSAVSRAYYGAFHEAQSVLATFGCRPKSGESHGIVRQLLEYTGNPDAIIAGRFLGDLQSARVAADYDLSSRSMYTVKNAELYIGVANKIVGCLSMFASNNASRESRAAIFHAVKSALVKTNRDSLIPDGPPQ